jgi:hypothetical protein
MDAQNFQRVVEVQLVIRQLSLGLVAAHAIPVRCS